MKRRKYNTIKILTAIAILVFAIIAVITAVLLLTKEETRKIEKVQVADEVEGYVLYDNATDYQKELFSSLRKYYDKEEEEEMYAQIIGKLFLADFYTLKTKISKNDVGGIQYVFEEYRTNFEDKAKNTVYHSVESNVYGDRTQELPVVQSIDVKTKKQVIFTYEKRKDNKAYEITYTVTYAKDLGYPKEVTLTLMHHNDKLEISKMEE